MSEPRRPSDPAQTDEYAEYMQESGSCVHRFQETNIFETPGNRIVIEWPNNPLDTFLPSIRAELKPRRLSIFNDTQYTGALIGHWDGNRRDGTSAKVNLSPSLEDLWHHVKKQHRNSIRQAEARGCTVRVADDASDFTRFYEIYDKFDRLKSLEKPDHDSLLALWETGITSIYFAVAERNEVATALILRSPTVWRYASGAGLLEFYCKYRPNNLLHWRIIQDAKKSGALWYDLGGAGPDNIFKMHFGAVRVPTQYLDWPKSLTSNISKSKYMRWGIRRIRNLILEGKKRNR